MRAKGKILAKYQYPKKLLRYVIKLLNIRAQILFILISPRIQKPVIKQDNY